MIKHTRQILDTSYRVYDNIYLINIHKNASMSIRTSLKPYGFIKGFNTIPNNAIKICVVRDPLERLLSCFFYIKRGESVNSEKHHPIQEIKKLDFFNEEDLIKSFNGFINSIEQFGLYSYVLYPQNSFLSDKNLSIDDINYFLIQENLKNDFKVISGKYNLPISELSHINKSNSKNALVGNIECDERKIKLIEYINSNKDLLNKINKIYESDFIFYDKIKEINGGYN